MHSPLNDKTAAEIDYSGLIKDAHTLIKIQKTMVLSTVADAVPWCAPVYYLFHAPYFYFFSSTRSRHIEQVSKNCNAAAAIFQDSLDWQQIRGIQMAGEIKKISNFNEKIKIMALFVLKFPFAETFLKPLQIRKKVREDDHVDLFMFEPTAIFYTNNKFGFGRRYALKF